MPSVISHALVAVALGRSQPRTVWSPRFWVLSIACAVAPDLDVVGYKLGVPYDHLFGHRGFSHSFVFAGLLGLLVVTCAFPQIGRWTPLWWRLVGYFSLVTASHGILDAFTNGGLGVAFFAPFDHTRYFFPWTPIKVSPLSLRTFFSSAGLAVLASELVWIGIPVMAAAVGLALFRRGRGGRKSLVWKQSVE
ncbi:MAG: metal-dependent hydrolase [Nitrospirae bacterium]|nr:MAG: metal-dependent hydrolase [Nitrospirota bacterium]